MFAVKKVRSQMGKKWALIVTFLEKSSFRSSAIYLSLGASLLCSLRLVGSMTTVAVDHALKKAIYLFFNNLL